MPHLSNSLRAGQALYGFTLLEWLLVVAMVSVLLVILFPVYQRVQQQAVTSKCAANMRSIGTAFVAFAADTDGDPTRHNHLASDLFVDGRIELLTLGEALQTAARSRGNLSGLRTL